MNLAELTEHKKTITYDIGNRDPGLEQAQNDCRHLMIKYIFLSNAYINQVSYTWS